MPYSFPNNIPRPARKWTESEQKKCISAANAVLRDDGSEQDAIFACIRAAGKTVHPGGKVLDRVREAFKQVGDYLFDADKADDGEIAHSSRIQDAWRTARGVDMVEVGPKQDMGWVREVFDDHVIVDSSMGLWKVPYSEDDDKVAFGEPVAVHIEYAEGAKGVQVSKVSIFKQADGRYRWVGWISNKYRDNDSPKEILSSKAHEEYAAYLDGGGEYPELLLWHVPGTHIGAADMVDFADGFLIQSGLIDEEAEKVAETFTGKERMSHRFERLKYDPKTAVTDQYRMSEISILPPGPEANPYTSFTSMKEEDMLSDDKKAFLIEHLGEEKVAEIEAKTAELRNAAEDAGVDFKEVVGIDDQTAPTSVEEIAAQLAEPVAKAVIESLELDNLSGALVAVKEAGDAMDARVAVIEGALKELVKSDDDKLVDKLTPKAADIFAWSTKRASQSEDTLLDKDKEEDKDLLSKGPDAGSALASFIGQITK